MTLVVDASVALKWVMEEEGAEAARALALDKSLISPDMLLIECANVLALKFQSGRSGVDDPLAALKLIELGVSIKPSRPHLHHAVTLSQRLRRTVYDCLYLALALEERAVLVTADRRFYAAAAADPLCVEAIRLL